MPDPRAQSYTYNMLYEGLDHTATNGPPDGELPRGWFDPTTWFSRPEEVLAVVLDRHPGTEYWTDFAGNIIVDVPGIGVRYLNSPGFSYADAQNLPGNFIMEDHGAERIGVAAGGYLGARVGAAAGSTFGPVGGLVGGFVGYGLGTAADRLWLQPARRAAFDGLELPAIPEPQGTPPLQVPSDLVAGVVAAMRGAHRQFVAATGVDVPDREFRAVFEPLVEMSGNMISLPYLASFGDYYSELATLAHDPQEQQYYLDMAATFDEVMMLIPTDALLAFDGT